MPHVAPQPSARPSCNRSAPRGALFASAAILGLVGAPAYGQETTNFTLDATNSSIESFSTSFTALSLGNFNNFFNGTSDFVTGPNSFDYATQFFTPSVSGDYVFGQVEAPTDTVMIVYKGSFDPANPGENFFAFNDDNTSQYAGSTWDEVLPAGVTIVSCAPAGTVRPTRCPIVGASLEAGEQYHVVISTYSTSGDLSFPLQFFVYGPGGVLVGEEEAEQVIDALFQTGLFEKPVQTRPQQPGGVYFDQVFLNGDRDGAIYNALVQFATLSEDQRRVFVESMSSETSISGTAASGRQMTRSTISTIGSRLAAVGRAGLSGAGSVGTGQTASMTAQSPAGEYVQFAMADMGDGVGFLGLTDARGGGASVGFDGSDTSELAELASTFSLQGGADVGQTNLWTEGYLGRGSGPSFDFQLYGGLVGADYRINENLLAGVFVGVGHSKVDGDDAARARVTSDSVSTGGYAAWYEGPLTLNASVVTAFGDNENRRDIVGLTTETVEGTNRTQEISISTGARYRIDITGQWSVSPTAQATHSWINQSSYTERGNSPLVMTYGGSNQTVWQTTLGLDTAFTVIDEDDRALALFGGLGWGMTDQSGGSTRVSLAADTSGNGFTLRPDTDTRHSLDVNAGLSWEQSLNGGRTIALRGAYEGSFGEDETGHTGRLAVAYRW